MKIEPLPNSFANLGEGPHWDIGSQSLYFVSLNEGKLFRYDYGENETYQVQIANEKFATFVIPIENMENQFAVGFEHHIRVIEWDGKSDKCKVISGLLEVETDCEHLKINRFNDGKCDPFGRLHAGTMHSFDYNNQKTGSLYVRQKNNCPKKLLNNIGISNGLTWDIKKKIFYYIDSLAYDVKAYDYDETSGDIKNGKVIIDFRVNGKDPEFLPDGMTIDTEGNLYVALYNGSKVVKVNPTTGKIEQEIEIPCKQITSVAFGGPNLDILYVTTAALGEETPAGQTFKVIGLQATGLEMAKMEP